MRKVRITGALGAIALCLALAGCETAGEKHLRAHFDGYFSASAPIQRLKDGDERLAAAQADGETAEGLATSDAETPQARVKLHLMGSATRFMRGQLGLARSQAEAALALCAVHRSEAQGPCQTADAFHALFTGLAILENTETVRPRTIASGTILDADDWSALAARAREYDARVFSTFSNPRAGSPPDDQSIRGEALRALAYEYCSMDLWETDPAARDAFNQSRPAIVRAHLSGFRKVGQAPASCPAEGDTPQCLEAAWAAVLSNFCAGE